MSRQNIAILFFYFLGLSTIRNLFFRFKHRSVTRIVMFHDILPEAEQYFKAKLEFLKLNTNVVSLNDFFAGKLSSKKINVVITFDDGFKSWITHAVPTLKKLGMPATFFVTSGFVGLSMAEEAEFAQKNLFLKSNRQRITGGLSLEDLKRIVDEGFAVGGHTLTHCILSELRDIDRIIYEIGEDKARLERITGKKIEYFAYPSGAYENPIIDVCEVLKDSGYRGAITTVPGFNSVLSNPYLLHRELTYANMPERVFRAIVLGNNDAVSFLKKVGRMVIRH
jgi:peptidoglycan/xylan/chitin deacetylase (PgdA/CDA1 family)